MTSSGASSSIVSSSTLSSPSTMRAKHRLSSWRATVGAVLDFLYIGVDLFHFPSSSSTRSLLSVCFSSHHASLSTSRLLFTLSTMPKALAPPPVFDRTGSESWTHVDILEFLRPAVWALSSFMGTPNWRRNQELAVIALQGQALFMVSAIQFVFYSIFYSFYFVF